MVAVLDDDGFGRYLNPNNAISSAFTVAPKITTSAVTFAELINLKPEWTVVPPTQPFGA